MPHENDSVVAPPGPHLEPQPIAPVGHRERREAHPNDPTSADSSSRQTLLVTATPRPPPSR
jgi:hypothetical protein